MGLGVSVYFGAESIDQFREKKVKERKAQNGRRIWELQREKREGEK
jgi:hypothetical protein